MKRTKKQITEDWKQKNREYWANHDPYIIVKKKQCSICKEKKQAKNFARNLDAKLGLQSWCNQCRHAKHVADPRKQMLVNARIQAKKKKLDFNIVLSDLIIPEQCPVLGIPIFIGSFEKNNSPSIDKIIPKLGYVKGNVRIISYRANTLKSNATLEEMLKIIEDLKKIYENKIN